MNTYSHLGELPERKVGRHVEVNIVFYLFIFEVLEFELRACNLSHPTIPFM
jgi:hypothetical protein